MFEFYYFNQLVICLGSLEYEVCAFKIGKVHNALVNSTLKTCRIVRPVKYCGCAPDDWC